MKATQQFKSAIEKYLSTLAQNDTRFAPHFAKASKNIESCLHYIFAEVKKTGLCVFDNQEIFDMAVKYYTDDSISTPAPITCKVVVDKPTETDLFSQPEIPATPVQPAVSAPAPAKQNVKPAQTTLTLFDL